MSSPIARFEEFMERLLETSIARILDSRLEESVIMRRLERAMESNQVMRGTQVIVPHAYYAFINPIDFKALTSKNAQLNQTLTNYLFKLAQIRRFVTISTITVQPISDSTSDLATVRIAFDPIPLTGSESTDTLDAIKQEFLNTALPTSIHTRPEHYTIHTTYQISVDNGTERTVYPITQTQLNIGRSDNDNDIILSDHLVSRNHARINYSNRQFYITDLASSNGTKINGYLIQKPDFLIAVDKDVITMGSYTMQIKRIYHDE
jgi:pSer/pThr/pTyr-binding forkhead associated (FHA) protein